MTRTPKRPFRSRAWFNAPGRADWSALLDFAVKYRGTSAKTPRHNH